MREAVLTLWPRAPITAASPEGRWLRFDRHPRGVIYLQRYAWDAPCTPHYLLVACRLDGDVHQEKHVTLPAAVAALRRALGAPEPGAEARRSRLGRTARASGATGSQRWPAGASSATFRSPG
jgi:hypothetical protein